MNDIMQYACCGGIIIAGVVLSFLLACIMIQSGQISEEERQRDADRNS